jgi:hypothetical protein
MNQHMLSEEQVSSYVDALIRLGVLHRVAGQEGDDEVIRFRVKSKRVIGRLLGGEFGEPPGGVEIVPWFSCMLVKVLLEERDIAVSKEEFTGMAAVIMGFMTEPDILRRLQSGEGRLVVSRAPAKRGGTGRSAASVKDRQTS